MYEFVDEPGNFLTCNMNCTSPVPLTWMGHRDRWSQGPDQQNVEHWWTEEDNCSGSLETSLDRGKHISLLYFTNICTCVMHACMCLSVCLSVCLLPWVPEVFFRREKREKEAAREKLWLRAMRISLSCCNHIMRSINKQPITTHLSVNNSNSEYAVSIGSSSQEAGSGLDPSSNLLAW